MDDKILPLWILPTERLEKKAVSPYWGDGIMMEPFQKVWICHSMWLFHLHSAVKIQPFSLVFPLAGSTAKAFYRLILWNFKEKSINHFP